MADKKYDSIVYEYFEQQHGAAVLISEDQIFKKMLASTIYKVTGARRNNVFIYENVQTGLKKVQECQKSGMECIVFIERLVANRPSTDTIITMKQLLPDLRIIVLVGETKRENIAYFYEIGVNNVISKPASMNNIVEKLAFTIKPQGKLSQYMGLGKKLLAQGKLKESLDVSTKILKLKPDSPAGLMLRGDVFLEAGKRERAIECYLKAHESSRLYLEPIKKLANAYEGVDQEMYLQYLKKLDRLSPLNADRKTNIGKVYIERKEMARAEKYFDLALETATKEAMSLVGNVAEKITDAVGAVSPEMSEKYLSQVIDSKGDGLGKEDITLFNKLGIALRGQGKWKEAIENYTRALTISPDDEGLYYNMGMAYYDGKLPPKAAQCFDAALQKNPDFFKHSEGVSMNMGAIYTDVRQYDKARLFYENARLLNPKNGTAVQKLAKLDKLEKN